MHPRLRRRRRRVVHLRHADGRMGPAATPTSTGPMIARRLDSHHQPPETSQPPSPSPTPTPNWPNWACPTNRACVSTNRPTEPAAPGRSREIPRPSMPRATRSSSPESPPSRISPSSTPAPSRQASSPIRYREPSIPADAVEFTCAATGTAHLYYQWLKKRLAPRAAVALRQSTDHRLRLRERRRQLCLPRQQQRRHNRL